MKKKYSPIIITGMHRSGTTLLSKILEKNGVFMGRYKEINNESKFFLRINRWMFTMLGASWDNPKSFHNISIDTKKIILNRVNNIISSKYNFYFFGLHSLFLKKSFNDLPFKWGWKDPRNTFTLPLWLKIFPDAKVVNIERHPLDSSLSLLNRQKSYKEIDLKMKNKFYYPLTNLLSISHSSLISSTLINDIDDCLKITKEYILESNENNNNCKNIINIKYEDLLSNPYDTIEYIFNHCNLIINEQTINNIIKTIESSNINKYKNNNLVYNVNVLRELGYDE